MLYLQLEKLKEVLSPEKKIIITTHSHPDGDAIGSSMGLYHLLKTQGLSSTVIVPTPLPAYLQFLPDIEEAVITYETQTDECKKILQESDVYFYLDFNHPSRTGNMMHQFLQKQQDKICICIDHHLDFDTDLYPFYYSESEKSSTCEMIFDFMEMMGWREYLNEKIMTSLYTGMVTDTGSFRFSSTSSRVHEIVSLFISKGLKAYKIHDDLFNQNSERKLKLLGHLLSEKMQIFLDEKYGFIFLDLDTATKYNLQPGDTEGFVNYILSISGIKVAIFGTQRFDGIKLSMRSEGEIDSNIFMRTHFKGGGHKNAAGGFTNLKWPEIEKIFANYLPNFIHQYL